MHQGARVSVGLSDFAADAANEGIEQTLSGLTAGADYVLRPVLHYSQSAVPIIKVLDATNGDALISSITCPDQTRNLVLNGGFDSGYGELDGEYRCYLRSEAGGVSGNCLEVTQRCCGMVDRRYQAIQLAPYATYRIDLLALKMVQRLAGYVRLVIAADDLTLYSSMCN